MKQRYEHAFEQINMFPERNVPEAIKRREQDGWELCGIMQNIGHMLIFKRPIEQ